ncbi:MAG TPA: phosphatase PAP2 family protein [Solirubrobacteraceae bacterium]|nr:phosphatase PAP2 family protein [Solirubrobacteraceae bacterium]
MAWLARRTTTPALLALVTVGWFVAVLAVGIVCGHLLRLAERPDGSTPFDSSITTWMVAHRTGALTTLARSLSAVGSQKILIPVAGVAAVLLLARRRLVLAGLVVVTWGGALGLYNLVKHFVHRPRPPAAIWLMKVTSTSFPSGHATQSLATFLALAFVAAALAAGAGMVAKGLALALAAAIGWSRVYLGVHWTTDVIAGWLIGAAWITIVLWGSRIATTIERRRGGEGTVRP